MAEKKISELVALGAITGSNPTLVIVQGSDTLKIDASVLANYASQWSAKTGSSNTFVGTQTFNGLVSATNGLSVNGTLSAAEITALNVYTSSVNTNLLGKTLISSSAQISSNISGSFTNLSSSVSARLTSVEASSGTTNGLISSSAQIGEFNYIHSTTGSLNTFTSSIRGEVNGIEAYTASLKGVSIVSSSTQISNYGIFATTSSNTFFGVEGITGSLLIDGTILDIETGDFVIKAESGVDIKIIPNGNKNFLFGTDGILTLPLGGDVKVESGNTLVLHSVDNLNTYTGSNNSVIQKVLQATSSIHFSTQSLNTQTGSQDLVNLGISIVTGSVNSYTSSNESWKEGVRGEVNGLEAYTASLKGAIEVSGQDVNVLGMITAQQFNVTYVSSSTLYQSGSTKFGNTTDDKHEFTGSVDVTGGITGSLMATNGVVSSSTQIQNYDVFALNSNLYEATGSIKAEIGGIEAYTASLKGAAIVSSSQQIQNYDVFALNSNLYEATGSIYAQTASQDGVNLGISIVTGSLNAQTASQNSVNFGISVFTASIREEVNSIEAYTASLRTALSVTESMVHFNSAITASVVSSSYIKFDSLPNGTAPSYQEGLIYYDNDMGALTFYNNEPDISLQIGQEQYVRAINKSGDDILNGTPVRVSGSQGDRVKIYKAEAFIHTGSYSDSEAHNHILGIVTHDILNDETGYVTIAGLVKGINTDNYEAGDILYVQTGSAGVLTNVAPPFPYDKIQVGIVGRKHPSVGEVLVLPKEPTHFGNITGLSGSATTEVGDLWVYKSNNAWATSKTLEGDYTITGSTTINNVLKLEAADELLSTGVEAGMIMASASYGYTNLYMYDGSEWKWLVTGSI